MGLGFIKQKGQPKILNEIEIKNLLLEYKLIMDRATTKNSSLGLPNNAFNLYKWLEDALSLLGLLPLNTIIPSNLIELENTLFVSKNGDDSTGTRNRLDLPFLGIEAAILAANPGDCIIVLPGAYVTTELLATDTSLYLYPNTTVKFTGGILDFSSNAGIYGNGNIDFTNQNPITITGDSVFIEAEKITMNGEIIYNGFTSMTVKCQTLFSSSKKSIHIQSPASNSSCKIDINNLNSLYSTEGCIIIENLSKSTVDININKSSVSRLSSKGFLFTRNTDYSSVIKFNCNSHVYLSPIDNVESKYAIVKSESNCYAVKDYSFNYFETPGKLYEHDLTLAPASKEKGVMKFHGKLLEYPAAEVDTYIDFTKFIQDITFDLDIIDETTNTKSILLISAASTPYQTVTGKIVGRPTAGTEGIIEFNANQKTATLENLTIISTLKPSIRVSVAGIEKINSKNIYTNVATSPDNGGVALAYGTLIVNPNIL
jgi:hypothetical protein